MKCRESGTLSLSIHFVLFRAEREGTRERDQFYEVENKLGG